MRLSDIVFLMLSIIFSCFLFPLSFAGELVYSTYIGGSNEDYGYNLAIDTFGNVYITGYTMSTDFPVTAGAYDTSTNGDADVYIAKLNSTGTALLYATYLGGSNADEALGIAVDSAGNVYITGDTNSLDFPTTPGAFATSYRGYGDAFITKLNPTGSALVYSTYFGGSNGYEVGQIIAIDAAGNAFITGNTDALDFPTTAGAFDTTYNGGAYDAYISKLNPTGTGLVYSTYVGGTNTDYGRSLAIDAEGNAYLVGETESPDFPITAGAFDTTYNGLLDIYITKLNSDGTALVYSTYLGTAVQEHISDIAIDGSGNAYLSGYTNSTVFPTTPGAFDTTYNDGGDIYITKLNPTGSGLIYSTYLGGSGFENGLSIAVNGSGNVYLTGQTISLDFPTTVGAFDTSFNGVQDAFILQLNSAGSGLLYSSYLGGNDNEYGHGIAVDEQGNTYVGGETYSSDFPTTTSAYDRIFHGIHDVYITKFYLTPLLVENWLHYEDK
ncbi:MAG: SBBP repeat-containing protein [bacterium]